MAYQLGIQLGDFNWFVNTVYLKAEPNWETVNPLRAPGFILYEQRNFFLLKQTAISKTFKYPARRITLYIDFSFFFWTKG